jgi:hypothetical protein
VYTDVADFTCLQVTDHELQRASSLPLSIEKIHVRLGCCCMTTSGIALPYRPGSDLLKPPILRRRAKDLIREDGVAGADGLHSAL